MNATEILSQEHQVILQVLDCLERMIQETATTGTLDGQAARDAVEFFQGFADQCHHAKEEDHLFPAMEAKGFPRHGGPTGVMLNEHRLGRECVRGMNDAIEAAANGDRDGVQRFEEFGQTYLNLLRQHIEKEDHCLFGMANQALSEQDQRDLLAAFQKVEADQMKVGAHEKYLAIAQSLVARYGIAKAGNSRACHNCGCGH